VGIARRSSHHVAVILEGNIVADLELTYTPSGNPVVRFPVLVNRRRKGPDTEQWCDGAVIRAGRRRVRAAPYRRPRRAESKKAVTRCSYSRGRAANPPVWPPSGTSQISLGSSAAA
jgi:Single-strand binding protein family